MLTRILDKGGSPSWPFPLYLDGLNFFVHMNVTEYWNGETECQVTISNGVILKSKLWRDVIYMCDDLWSFCCNCDMKWDGSDPRE